MKKAEARIKSNIVFILADDLGYGDLGCYGAQLVETPNIDGLAEGGLRFTDAHSPSSVCTPSRYNLLTGRYCWRTWAKTGCVWAHDPMLIERGRTTLASLCKSAGYATGMVGKWHLGLGDPGGPHWDEQAGQDYNREVLGPRSVGFDYFFGVPVSIGAQEPHVFIENEHVVNLDLDDPLILHHDWPVEFLRDYQARPRGMPPNLHYRGGAKASFQPRLDEVTLELTGKAVEYIDRHADEPFFLYYAPRNVHGPIRPHPRFQGKSRCGAYGDFIVELDWAVGEVVAALKRNAVFEQTLIIISSDNGGVRQHHRAIPAGDTRPIVEWGGHPINGIFRGQKTELYEGGHRVPLIAHWPGKIRPGRVAAETVALTDMLPTFAAFLGRELPEEAAEDGFDILPLLLDISAPAPREALVHDSLGGFYAVRQGDWKLILAQHGGGLGCPWRSFDPEVVGPPFQLFNLREDPGETMNRITDLPQMEQELKQLLFQYWMNGKSRR